jgi:hypothetical protein
MHPTQTKGEQWLMRVLLGTYIVPGILQLSVRCAKGASGVRTQSSQSGILEETSAMIIRKRMFIVNTKDQVEAVSTIER